MSDDGVRFTKVPIFQSRHHNTRLIWKVSVLVSIVESLWRMISDYYEFRSLNWHGWMLAYLYKNCFNKGNCRQSPADPFKCRSIDMFKNKVQRHKLCSYFDDLYLPEVHYFDLSTHFDGNLFFVMMNSSHFYSQFTDTFFDNVFQFFCLNFHRIFQR